MLDQEEAKKIAEPIVKTVVDCIVDKKYEDIFPYTDSKEGLSLELLSCCNDTNNPMHHQFEAIIKELKEDSSVSEEIKRAIDEFSW